VTFKKHQIHLRPGFRPIQRTLGSSPHSLVGWDLGQGGAAGRTFAPSGTDGPKGAITTKIKHAIKLKTSPARLAQLLQPSLFSILFQLAANDGALDGEPSLAAS